MINKKITNADFEKLQSSCKILDLIWLFKANNAPKYRELINCVVTPKPISLT